MKLCLVLASVLAALGLASAQQTHVVKASGEATIYAKPDRVQLAIGVSTHGATAETASADNAKATSQVLQAVKSVLASAGEVTTSGYSLSPDYIYTPNNPPKPNGYTADNRLEVKLDDVSQAGKVMDAATSAGATNINGISFTLRDDSAPRAQALAQAAARARANAQAIAQALNLRVTGIAQAESADAVNVRPVNAAPMVAMRAAQTTPVEPGNVEIHATVIVALAVE